jgi:hypothetical protein
VSHPVQYWTSLSELGLEMRQTKIDAIMLSDHGMPGNND